jgi:phenylpyruvate tautomerase PptA (4-oxalocrotonate tautomerase family)
MPLIQIDLQPLSNEQRAELRTRVTAAVSRAIGSPFPYVSVAIRESEPSSLVEAGGWGPYGRREMISDPGDGITAVASPPDDDASKERAHG